jgi:hypothetical protein
MKTKLKDMVKFICKMVPTAKQRGSLIPKTNDNGLYGFVFRNVNWGKLNKALPQLQKDLDNIPWNVSIHIGRDIDPFTKELGKDKLPLETSYAYLGKDFREVPDVDKIVDNDFDLD